MPDLNCPDCETETLEPIQPADQPLQIVGVQSPEDLKTGPYFRRYECTTCAKKVWLQDD